MHMGMQFMGLSNKQEGLARNVGLCGFCEQLTQGAGPKMKTNTALYACTTCYLAQYPVGACFTFKPKGNQPAGGGGGAEQGKTRPCEKSKQTSHCNATFYRVNQPDIVAQRSSKLPLCATCHIGHIGIRRILMQEET